MSALSDLLVQSLPAGMTRRQVARQARAKGHRLGDATATAYFRGQHGTPDRDTLEAFASVLPVSFDQLRRAAGLAESRGPWVPPETSEHLTAQERAALDALIRAVTTGRQETQDVPPKTRAADGRHQDYALAARPGTPERTEADVLEGAGEGSQDPEDSDPA